MPTAKDYKNFHRKANGWNQYKRPVSYSVIYAGEVKATGPYALCVSVKKKLIESGKPGYKILIKPNYK